jgi:hypothetical protein
MPIDATQVAKLREEYERARAQLDKEDAERFRILREYVGADKLRELVNGLTEKNHRVLFGLELPDEPKRERRRREEGTLECPICHKRFKNERGLKIHMGREHPEQARQPELASGPSAEEAS